MGGSSYCLQLRYPESQFHGFECGLRNQRLGNRGHSSKSPLKISPNDSRYDSDDVVIFVNRSGGEWKSSTESVKLNEPGDYEVYWDTGLNPQTKSVTVTRTEPTIGETGTAVVDSDWTEVEFKHPGGYEDPVVVMGPPSHRSSDFVHPRVKNVTTNSFEVKMEEWDYDDGSHWEERVDYMVVEEGVHELEDGTLLEAGTKITDENMRQVSLEGKFISPVVASTVQTYNGPDAVVTRMECVSPGRFECDSDADQHNRFGVKVQEQQTNGEHTDEDIGYVAVEKAGTGNPGKVTATKRWFGHPSDVSVGSVVGPHDTPGVVGQILTYHGENPAGLRLKGTYNDDLDADDQTYIEEEQSKNSETGHITERIGMIGFETDDILSGHSAPESDIGTPTQDEINTMLRVGEAGTTLIPQGDPDHTIHFERKYDNPVVIVGPATSIGSQPAHPRVKSVSSTSATVTVEEWDYEDGFHFNEHIDYVVVEEGRHKLRDGGYIEAGTVTTGTHWEDVGLSHDFTEPRAFASVQTYNGSDSVVTRMKGLGSDEFSVKLQEQEDKFEDYEGHRNEEIGYLAVEGETNQASYHATNVTIDHNGDTLDHVGEYPNVIGQITSYNGNDPAGLRLPSTDPDRSVLDKIYIEEEKSWNDETDHTDEAVSLLGFDWEDGFYEAS